MHVAANAHTRSDSDWASLDDRGTLAWRAATCRNAVDCSTGCRICVQACPSGALDWAGTGPELDEARCTGCGRCAARCPDAALAPRGFGWPRVARESREPLPVDCYRAPFDAEAWRVPCLGGLDATHLLFLRAAAGERTIELRDHGLCPRCSAHDGIAAHPARAALNEAIPLLEAAGVPRALLPQGLQRDGAAIRPHNDPAQATLETTVDRRRFFRRLAGEGLALSEVPVRAAAQPRSLARKDDSRRAARIALLRGLARRHGGTLPASEFHALTASEHCLDHGACVRVCPTQALVRSHDASGIDFHADRCNGCAVCIRLCPERALTITSADTAPAAGPAVLTRHRQRECARCGADFVGGDSGDACPHCAKSQHLARAAFDLFRRAPERMSDHGPGAA